MDRYLDVAGDVVYHTDDIQALRSLETAIRSKHSTEGVKKQVKEVLNNDALSEDQRETLLAEIGAKDRGHLSHLAQELTEYTNLLAGKKSLHDRIIETDAGRAVYQVMSQLENRVAANMVAVNPASWLTNFLPIAQINADCSMKSILDAAMNTAQNAFRNDGFENKSTFLTNRAGIDQLSQTWTQKATSALAAPMEWIDMFMANIVTRARYLDNIKAGMDHASAVDDADQYAASVMADRSKGALPTIFNRKNPRTRLFTMYQVEANNTIRHPAKDLPRNAKEAAEQKAIQKLLERIKAEGGQEEKQDTEAGGNAVKQDPSLKKRIAADAAARLAKRYAKYFLAVYLFCDLYEYFIGRRPDFDPIGIANKAVGKATGYQLPNTVEAVKSIAQGKAPDMTAKKTGAVDAVTGVGSDLAESVPFVGGLLGGGRFPISSAVPDIWNVVKANTGMKSGEIAPNKGWNMISKEIAKPGYYLLPPFGGGQIKKAVEGITTVAQGGSYGLNNKGEKTLRFPVEDQSPLTYLQAATFGPYSLPMAKEYVDSGFRSKSTSYTKQYQAAMLAGIPGDTFRDWKNRAGEMTATKNAKGNAIQGTREKKLRALLSDYDLTQKQKDLLLSWEGY